MEQVQNQERLRRHAQSAAEKVRLYNSQQSLFGMVQNVQTCPDCHGTGKIIREKCPDCAGTGYISSKKKILSRFRQELMTDRCKNS